MFPWFQPIAGCTNLCNICVTNAAPVRLTNPTGEWFSKRRGLGCLTDFASRNYINPGSSKIFDHGSSNRKRGDNSEIVI